MTERHTVVCRNLGCGGGWWGDVVPTACPHCGRQLIQLAPVMVTKLEVPDGR